MKFVKLTRNKTYKNGLIIECINLDRALDVMIYEDRIEVKYDLTRVALAIYQDVYLENIKEKFLEAMEIK